MSLPRELANRSTKRFILSLFDILKDITDEVILDITVCPETTIQEVIDSINELKSAGKIIAANDTSRMLVRARGS